ncbi:MAG: hypothetical protein J6Y10_04070 [Lachnospiraceae bacterium]|nr:hypothetical protein [Lachnospiraceae bacterium]
MKKLWSRIISVICMAALLLPVMPERAKADPAASVWIKDVTFDYKGGHIDCEVSFGNSMYADDKLEYIWIGSGSKDPSTMNANFCDFCTDKRFYPEQIIGTTYYMCQVFDATLDQKLCDSNVVAVTFTNTIQSIYIEKAPTKVKYKLNEKFDPKGMEITISVMDQFTQIGYYTYKDDEWKSVLNCSCVKYGESDGNIGKPGDKAFQLSLKECSKSHPITSDYIWVTYDKEAKPTATATPTPTKKPTATPTPTKKPTATPTPKPGAETKIIGKDGKTYTIIEMKAKGRATAITNLRTIPAYSSDSKYFLKDSGGNKISLPKDTKVDVTGQCKETK